MGNAERQNQLMNILCGRRYETIEHLAEELGVSTRTIRRDITELSRTEPIYTQAGRYGGGVYVMEGYRRDRLYLANEEIAFLQKLQEGQANLTARDRATLQGLISKYSKPKIN